MMRLFDPDKKYVRLHICKVMNCNYFNYETCNCSKNDIFLKINTFYHKVYGRIDEINQGEINFNRIFKIKDFNECINLKKRFITP